MNYREAIQYVRRIQKGDAVKPGLGMTKRLMEYLGNPQDKLDFVHVAGTNGKGSTAAFISSIYAAHGLKVGRYVSPAVFSEFEKIQYVYGGEYRLNLRLRRQRHSSPLPAGIVIWLCWKLAWEAGWMRRIL